VIWCDDITPCDTNKTKNAVGEETPCRAENRLSPVTVWVLTVIVTTWPHPQISKIPPQNASIEVELIVRSRDTFSSRSGLHSGGQVSATITSIMKVPEVERAINIGSKSA
jgi:hypothetical protein